MAVTAPIFTPCRLQAHERLALPPTVGLGTLRRLGALDFGGRPVLSLYLDLGGPAGHNAMSSETERLLAEIGGRLREEDAGRIRGSLRALPALAGAARGLAAFCAADGSTLEPVPLPARVQTFALLDSRPWLEPLAAMASWGAKSRVS